MLKMTNKVVISDNDWDDFIQKTYGKIYCFQQQDDCRDRGNYSFTVPNPYGADGYDNDEIEVRVNGAEMGVSLKAWIERTEKFFMDDFNERLFWHRNFYPDLYEIVEDLYNKGLLEAGDYTIEVDW